MTVLRDPLLPLACNDLAGIAETHFVEAEKAMRECSHRAMRPAAVMRAVYHAVAAPIARRGLARSGDAGEGAECREALARACATA